MLLGEEERPLPNMLGTIIKYFSGLSAMSGPMSQSFSQCLPAIHTCVSRGGPSMRSACNSSSKCSSTLWQVQGDWINLPEYQVGYTIALLLLASRVPQVL